MYDVKFSAVKVGSGFMESVGYESVRGVECLPWYHRNADYDEVVLIHGGNALSRPMPLGVIGHEPQGLHHGFGEKIASAQRP